MAASSTLHARVVHMTPIPPASRKLYSSSSRPLPVATCNIDHSGGKQLVILPGRAIPFVCSIVAPAELFRAFFCIGVKRRQLTVHTTSLRAQFSATEPRPASIDGCYIDRKPTGCGPVAIFARQAWLTLPPLLVQLQQLKRQQRHTHHPENRDAYTISG